MRFPELSDEYRLDRLLPPTSKVRTVLDTDTYNEIDDQFAVAYALRSTDHLSVEAIYAAPFLNSRSSGPADGMDKSYAEIVRLLERLDISIEQFAFKGSEGFLQNLDKPYKSEAALDLVARAMQPTDEPLYVVAIGAITNVASAILIEPDIVKKIVVVWLAGHPIYWPQTAPDFNSDQDIVSSRLIFDCGVPLVQVPCLGVSSHLLTTVPELAAYLKGKSRIGDYLFRIFCDYSADHFAWAKEIWDISTIAWLVNSDWVPSTITHSPILTDQHTWSVDHSRHLMRSATFLHRNPIFRDLFVKLS